MDYGEKNWRVELHVHLDGSYRPSTILEIAKERGIELPSSSSAEEFAEFARVKQPGTLNEFLANFPVWMNVVAGNKEAIRRTVYDFVEDCSLQNIAYVETRFAPLFLVGENVTGDDVLSITLDSIREAEKKFGTKCNVIVSIIRERRDLARETFELAKRFYGKGVVGIDVAGAVVAGNECLDDGELGDEIKEIFQEAKSLGMHRTVHAGENGPAKSVRDAVFQMAAQRIGHGYRVLQDMSLYEQLKSMNIHFETCPSSSIITGGASPDWSVHPIRTFCKDKVNYSVNTDDTLIIGHQLSEEYKVCQDRLNLDPGEIVRCNFNAAKSAFLEDTEKEKLLDHMRTVLNMK